MVQASIRSWLQKGTTHEDTDVQVQSPDEDRSEQSANTELRTNQSPGEKHVDNDSTVTTLAPVEQVPDRDIVYIPGFENLSSLPPNVGIEACSKERLVAFRRLNSLLLPIPYRDEFYRETLEDPIVSSLTRVAIWHPSPSVGQGQLVGGIRCRIFSQDSLSTPTSIKPVLYISTIGTLAPFRGHAIATHLLAIVARVAKTEYGAQTINAHVWEENEDALKWYEKRGFVVSEKLDNYYKRLAPKNAAFLMEKQLD